PRAGVDRQLLGREELLAVDLAVDDPLVDEARPVAARSGDRLDVVAVLEPRVDVGVPVELLDDGVEGLVDRLRHVLYEQRTRPRPRPCSGTWRTRRCPTAARKSPASPARAARTAAPASRCPAAGGTPCCSSGCRCRPRSTAPGSGGCPPSSCPAPGRRRCRG